MNWNENKKLGKWKKLSIFQVLRSRSRHFKNGPGADFLLVESRERDGAAILRWLRLHFLRAQNETF